MKEPGSNPARDAFRRTMERATKGGVFERGIFGDNIPLRLHAARSGDIESLVSAFEDGEALSDVERRWLADYLNGVARIERRKLERRVMEYKLVLLVSQYVDQGMTEYGAINAVLDQHLNLERETLRTYLQNSGNNR